MGYTTNFTGSLNITPPLSPEQTAYINQFRLTRRMKRDTEITATRPDPIREAVGLPLGEQSGYFVGAAGFAGQEEGWGGHAAIGVLDYNAPPAGQPGLWCQWEVSEDGNLQWDEGEKFYSYTEWLEYLIQHFFAPWGKTLNGSIHWDGEDSEDRGMIWVKNNEVQAIQDTITNECPFDAEGDGE